MKLNNLEKDILDWISRNADDANLIKQLGSTEVVSREYTGAGSFTYLSITGDAPKCIFDIAPIDPAIDSPDLESGGGCVLHLKDGYIDYLEIYAFGNVFPENLKEYDLNKSNNS